MSEIPQGLRRVANPTRQIVRWFSVRVVLKEVADGLCQIEGGVQITILLRKQVAQKDSVELPLWEMEVNGQTTASMVYI